MAGSGSHSNQHPADREPKIAKDGDSAGPLHPVIAMDAVSLVALERLNRQSIIHILEEVVREIDQHCQLFGNKSAIEVDKLRLEVLALIDRAAAAHGEEQLGIAASEPANHRTSRSY
jgi:hypothetical protein